MDESEYDNGIVSRIRDAQDKSEKVDSILGADDEWESSPPHPDNIGYTDGQIDKKVEGKKDIFQNNTRPVDVWSKTRCRSLHAQRSLPKRRMMTMMTMMNLVVIMATAWTTEWATVRNTVWVR